MPKQAKSKQAKDTRAPRGPPPPPLRIVDALCTDAVAVVLKMLSDGVAVFPVLCSDEVKTHRHKLNEATKLFPEFNAEYAKDGALFGNASFSGGSFGCLGSPAANHCRVVRDLREIINGHVRKIMKTLEAHPRTRELFPGLEASATFIEMIIDRLCVRGTLKDKETWHVDDSPHARPVDAITGGWLNLGPDDQFFACQLGSHALYRDPLRKLGFTPIKDPVRRAELDASGVKVRVPVGHAIMFFQVTAHAVNPENRKGKLPSARLYFGARLTTDSDPLGGRERLVKTLADLAPVIVKSSQDAPLWPKMYAVTPSGRALLEKLTKNAYKNLPGLRETVTVQTTGEVYERVKRLCPSYKELGLLDTVQDLCPPYTEEEIAKLLPTLPRDL